MKKCCVCNRPTPLPYTCRACWGSIGPFTKVRFYELINSKGTARAEGWLRRRMR